MWGGPRRRGRASPSLPSASLPSDKGPLLPALLPPPGSAGASSSAAAAAILAEARDMSNAAFDVLDLGAPVAPAAWQCADHGESTSRGRSRSPPDGSDWRARGLRNSSRGGGRDRGGGGGGVGATRGGGGGRKRRDRVRGRGRRAGQHAAQRTGRAGVMPGLTQYSSPASPAAIGEDAMLRAAHIMSQRAMDASTELNRCRETVQDTMRNMRFAATLPDVVPKGTHRVHSDAAPDQDPALAQAPTMDTALAGPPSRSFGMDMQSGLDASLDLNHFGRFLQTRAATRQGSNAPDACGSSGGGRCGSGSGSDRHERRQVLSQAQGGADVGGAEQWAMSLMERGLRAAHAARARDVDLERRRAKISTAPPRPRQHRLRCYGGDSEAAEAAAEDELSRMEAMQQARADAAAARARMAAAARFAAQSRALRLMDEFCIARQRRDSLREGMARWRATMWQHRRREQRRAALVLQAWCRVRLCRNAARQLRRKARRDNRLQHAALGRSRRLFTGRRIIRNALMAEMLHDMLEQAVTAIQAAMRGFLCRKPGGGGCLLELLLMKNGGGRRRISSLVNALPTAIRASKQFASVLGHVRQNEAVIREKGMEVERAREEAARLAKIEAAQAALGASAQAARASAAAKTCACTALAAAEEARLEEERRRAAEAAAAAAAIALAASKSADAMVRSATAHVFRAAAKAAAARASGAAVASAAIAAAAAAASAAIVASVVAGTAAHTAFATLAPIAAKVAAVVATQACAAAAVEAHAASHIVRELAATRTQAWHRSCATRSHLRKCKCATIAERERERLKSEAEKLRRLNPNMCKTSRRVSLSKSKAEHVGRANTGFVGHLGFGGRVRRDSAASRLELYTSTRGRARGGHDNDYSHGFRALPRMCRTFGVTIADALLHGRLCSMRAAATTISRAWWHFLARLEVWWRIARRRAATRIQSVVFRPVAARLEARRRRAAASEIGRVGAGNVGRDRARKRFGHVIVWLMSAWRWDEAGQPLQGRLHEDARPALTCVIRSWHAARWRYWYQGWLTRWAQMVEEERVASTDIQRVMRGTWGRRVAADARLRAYALAEGAQYRRWREVRAAKDALELSTHELEIAALRASTRKKEVLAKRGKHRLARAWRCVARAHNAYGVGRDAFHWHNEISGATADEVPHEFMRTRHCSRCGRRGKLGLVEDETARPGQAISDDEGDVTPREAEVDDISSPTRARSLIQNPAASGGRNTIVADEWAKTVAAKYRDYGRAIDSGGVLSGTDSSDEGNDSDNMGSGDEAEQKSAASELSFSCDSDDSDNTRRVKKRRAALRHGNKDGVCKHPLPAPRVGEREGLGLFFCRKCFQLRSRANALLQQALPEGWAQKLDEETWTVRYINTLTGESRLTPRPTDPAVGWPSDSESSSDEEGGSRKTVMKKMMEKHKAEGMTADEALEAARRDARRHGVLMRYYHDYDLDDDDRMAAKIVKPRPGHEYVDKWQLKRKKRRKEWAAREQAARDREAEGSDQAEDAEEEVKMQEPAKQLEEAHVSSDNESSDVESTDEEEEMFDAFGAFKRPVAVQGNTILYGQQGGNTVHKFVTGPRNLAGQKVLKWFRGYGKFEGTVVRRSRPVQPEYREDVTGEEITQEPEAENTWVVRFADGKEYTETDTEVRKLWKAWQLDKSLGGRRDSTELERTQVTSFDCDPVLL